MTDDVVSVPAVNKEAYFKKVANSFLRQLVDSYTEIRGLKREIGRLEQEAKRQETDLLLVSNLAAKRFSRLAALEDQIEKLVDSNVQRDVDNAKLQVELGHAQSVLGQVLIEYARDAKATQLKAVA